MDVVAVASGRSHRCGRDAGHGDHSGTPARVSSGERSGVLFRWRSRRTRRRLAPLQQALPEAREGRELRFLFLPDGEDPDSLVGREGGEQFRCATGDGAAAVRVPGGAIGRAGRCQPRGRQGPFRRAGAAAAGEDRPWGLSRNWCSIASRLRLACRSSACSNGWRPRKARHWPPRAAPATAGRSARAPLRPVGRGSLVTQAITLLLHFPAAASAVSEQQRGELARMDQPGVAVLIALLEQLQASPAASMALTLERWRERPEYRRLCELASSAPLVPDQAPPARKLRQAVARLLDSELRRRLEVLIEKARGQPPGRVRETELQALTVAQTRVGGP